MAHVKADMLRHLACIENTLRKFDGDAFVSLRNLVLEIRVNQRRFVLYPQFMKSDGNQGRSYTPFFSDDVVRFIGWLPYFNKQWKMSSDKLDFKQYATANGMMTPEYSADPHANMRDVVVKKAVSTFGDDVMGPFRNSGEYQLRADARQYYERYVEGTITKIWFWNKHPVCLEFHAKPSVIGDGKKTIQQLIDVRAEQLGWDTDHKYARIKMFLSYTGMQVEDILDYGKEEFIGFRYGSILNFDSAISNIDLTTNMPADLSSQLFEMGEKLFNGIPAEIRNHSVFTVDAVLDAERKFSVLEMNSNPFIHPYVYPAMLKDIFADPDFSVAVPPPYIMASPPPITPPLSVH